VDRERASPPGADEAISRSPFATATHNPDLQWNVTPTLLSTSASRKLCVDPESNSDVSVAPLILTCSCIVRVVLDCMPVNAWSDIVGSSYGCSSSSNTSMINSWLQSCLWPLVNNSLQWKHCPLARRSTISAGESFGVGVGLVAIEVVDGADAEETVDPGTYATGLEKVCPADLDGAGGTARGRLRCS
jgi:hypothetical protein